MRILTVITFCALSQLIVWSGIPTFTQVKDAHPSQQECKRTPEEERQLGEAINFLHTKIDGHEIIEDTPFDWRSASFGTKDPGTDKCQGSLYIRSKLTDEREDRAFFLNFSFSDIDPTSVRSSSSASGVGYVTFEASPGKKIIKEYPAVYSRPSEKLNEAWLVVKDAEMARRVEKAFKDAVSLCCGKAGPY